MIINLNDQEKSEIKYNYFLMPDGQPHIQLKDDRTVFKVTCSITSMNSLGKLLVTIDALKRAGNLSSNWNLFIPYLLGGRQDRYIKDESLTLKVICDCINNLGANNVGVLHPHSPASLNFLDNSVEVDHVQYVEKAIEDFKPDLLIIPDLGAAKNAQKYEKFRIPQIQCYKKRDTLTGKLSGFGIYGGDIHKTARLLIIDDLVCGGGTFTGISELFPNCEMGLYTTHGLYSKGFGLLNKHFCKFYCTNSYHFNGLPVEIQSNSNKLTMFDIQGEK